MDKKHFVLHLLTCRPDFAFTMTPDEEAVMEKHVQYWMEKMSEGQVIVFGPVFDPKGPYGLGVVAAENEAAIEDFIKKDPASAINQYEYFPMQAVYPSQQVV